MEKHEERRTVRRCPGLLAFRRGCRGLVGLLAVLLLSSLFSHAFAAPSHASYLRSRMFKCQDEYVFSSTNTVFAVDIAYLPPEEISVYLNSIPNNVELVSIKKVTYIPPSSAGQGYGTHVEITVRFLSTGDVKLFAADLETKEGFFKIPFQSVHVWANMQILKPELSVSVDGGRLEGAVQSSVASHIGYTVRVKYASAVKSISYDIPENSIFVERERLVSPDDGQGQAVDFFPDFKDVARYDWQPLQAGDFELPPVKVVVQAYNGNVVVLPFPSIKVHVEQKEAGAPAVLSPSDSLPGTLADAFAESPVAADEEGVPRSVDDAQLLAELYGRELASFPFFTSTLERRQELEGRLGLDVRPPIPRRPVLIVLLLLVASSLVLFLVLLLQRSFARAAFVLVIILLFAVSALIYGGRLSHDLAVSKGGILYPIPETSVSLGASLPTASVVSILKKTGSWYYVSFNDTNGWIPAESVILVR